MFRLVVALLLIFAVCDTCEVRAQAPKIKRSTRVPSPKHQAPTAQPGAAGRDRAFSLDSINDVLWWLPEDTQTVSVVRGPFKAIAPIAEPPEDNPTAPISEPPEDNPTTEQVSLVLQMHPLGGFEAIKKGRYYKPLVGRNVLFGVEASRKFRSPTGLGEMRYEGCDIVILQPGLGTARDALLKQMASQAKQVQTIAGQQVVLFEETREGDVWKVFICIPQPDVLLCATNRAFLAQVLHRMHQRGKTRALPDSLPEWKHVDTRARFWAVRHYDRGDAQNDPSSPLSGQQLEANWPDTEAVGIVFNWDPGQSKLATIKYLSGNEDALRLFADQFAKIEEGFKPVIRLAEPGVVEMVVNLAERDSPAFLLVLLALLGHAVYL